MGRLADPESPKYAVSHAGHPKREHAILRGVGELFAEFFGEVIWGLLCLAVVAGLSAAGKYGWDHARTLTLGLAVAVGAFFTFGAFALVRLTVGKARPRPQVLAAVAGAFVVVMGLWVVTVVSYHL